MSKGDRRAKVTPETQGEARKLAELWATRAHPSQAVFGETYGIGNQSAVGQFLRGEVPLSLKAARGFAQGLGCRIEDFSARLAAEAAAIANMVPGDPLLPEVAQVASDINQLPPKQREWVLRTMREVIEAARETIVVNGNSVGARSVPDSGAIEPSSKRRRAA